MKVIKNQQAQGDVLATQVDALPPKAKLRKQKDNIIALGEATGHHHSASPGVEVFQDVENPLLKWVVVGEEGGTISHNANPVEHEVIRLAPGVHRIDLQTEVDMMTGVERRSVD